MSDPRFSGQLLTTASCKGLNWAVLHNGIGFRCGYVRLLPGHPWHGKHYDEIDANVHGGLTYAAADDDGGWWIGFDCAHCDDARDPSLPMPALLKDMTRSSPPRGQVIRTQEYVENQCQFLCEQAAFAGASRHLSPVIDEPGPPQDISNSIP